MPDLYLRLADRLLQLERVMRETGLWSSERPGEEAFASTMPFCADRMALEEWLQFVFIERMKVMVEARAPMPGPCAIRPMAEERLKSLGRDNPAFLDVLGEIDALVTHGGGAPRH